MSKRIIIPVIAILVIAAGIGTYLAFQKPMLPDLPRGSSPFGISIAGFLSNRDYEKSLNYMGEAGASTVRFMAKPSWGALSWSTVEPEKGIFDWSEPDEHYLKAKENSLGIMVNIYPDTPKWDSDSEYVMDYPNDMNAYLDFIKRTAERYDGDEIDDAPGHPKVDEWGLGVELERSEDKKWWGGTPGEYADLFVKTYEAIKNVNPNATIMTYGTNIFIGIERGAIDTFTKLMLVRLSELTKNKPDFYFVYAIHYYEISDLNKYTYIINYTRDMLDGYGFNNIPIAITDIAPFLHKDDPLKEQKLAKSIIKTHVVGLAHDLKKIIWAQLSDGLEYGDSFEAGLISNPSMTPQDQNYYKNLGFYTYKLMTEKLDGFDNIQTIQASDNIYIYKFLKDNKLIWVAWSDNLQEKQITISGINSNQVKITETVPDAESGKELNENDYPNFFKTEHKIVSSGSITIMLKEIPIFIEEN